jgi:4-hydroxy-3-methylbut-2-enyl diphosphate reductase
VDLGYKSDGIISRNEFTDDTQSELSELVKPGDVFDVYVMRVNDGDGNVLVSKRKLDNQLGYQVLEQSLADKTPVSGKIVEVIKGGLMANIQGVRVFVPSSQISNRFVEDLTQFKGKEFDFQILELDRSKRRVVAGRKELAAQEAKRRRDELFNALEAGTRIPGTVSRIVDFGAFVDLGGIDGLVHISELSWKRVRKVTDVLQVGDAVNVTVISIDPEKNKISLTMRDNESNPWYGIADKYPVGEIIVGTVVRLAPWGAFVNLEDGVDGLVHISQIANHRVNTPDEELSVGQVINVLITHVDQENHKISLSKKDADDALGLNHSDDYDDIEEDEDYYDDEPHDTLEVDELDAPTDEVEYDNTIE